MESNTKEFIVVVVFKMTDTFCKLKVMVESKGVCAVLVLICYKSLVG